MLFRDYNTELVMKEFICSLGRTFSEHDLNSIESFSRLEYPNGYWFYNLDLSNTSITRLPSNLTVEGELRLSNCPLKMLPDQLVVHDLNLQGSNVTCLPTGLRGLASQSKGSSIKLYGSKIVSVGEHLHFDHLFIDSTEMFKNKFSCSTCFVIPKVIVEAQPSVTNTLDLRNIEMKNFYLNVDECSYLITNASAVSCQLSGAQYRSPCAYTISHSSFDTLKIGVENGSSLTFTESVDARLLEVFATSNSKLNFKLHLQAPHIRDVLMMGNLSQCLMEEFVLHGSLSILTSVSGLELPETGIVYGDIDISGDLKLPETFCCLGNVIYD